ncbi:MAG: DNRLRE domain-containing protein [Byssovorax sp.]
MRKPRSWLTSAGVPGGITVGFSALLLGALPLTAALLTGCAADPGDLPTPPAAGEVGSSSGKVPGRTVVMGHATRAPGLDESSRKPALSELPSPLPVRVSHGGVGHPLSLGGCPDADADGLCDGQDNCANIFNPSQADSDGDGTGDACDPACKKLIDNADAFIDGSKPDANHGGADPNEVGAAQKTLIRFDTKVVPGNATIVSATLTLTDKDNGTKSQANLKVFGLSTGFLEKSVNANNFGGLGAELGLGKSAPCSPLNAPPHPIACYGHYNISLPGLSGAPVSAVKNGLAVTTTDLPKLIRSREHVDDHPSLELCYVVPDPTCNDGVWNGQETGLDCGGPTCAPCVDKCNDGIQDSDESGVDCGGTFCGTCSQPYAEAMLSSGNTPVAFVFVPAGTTFNSNQDYDDYCVSKGFSGNRTGSQALGQDGNVPGFYDPSSYYCADYCCFLGFGNNERDNLHDFHNYGLPAGVPLQVFDRGCADWCTSSFSGDINTTDALVVNPDGSYSYNPGAIGDWANYCQPGKSTTFVQDGVVVCQAPNLCTGVQCPAPGPCQTAGVCNPIDGQCDYGAQPDLTACNDGDPSHTICLAGACAHDPCSGVVCTPEDACHKAGVCDQLTGQCSNPKEAFGKPCDDGDPDTDGTVCVNGTCQVAPPTMYASADLSTGNAPVVFLYAPAGLTLASDQDYDAYCEAHGFSGNRTGSQALGNNSYPGFYDPSSHYCSQYCCFLGFGNGMSGQLSNFHNYGLPEGQNLQVFDRGCGDWCTGTFAGDVNTTDGLTVNGPSAFSYNAGGFSGGTNYCQPGKSTTFANDGVVVCQAPNLCTGVVCNNPGPCQGAGSCNKVTGQCEYQSLADLTACNDGNPAHTQCLGGVCSADPCIGVSCGGAIDQCHLAQVCDKHNGQCVNPNAPSGTPCDDNNPNTPTSACYGGVCSASPCIAAGMDTLVIDGVIFCYTQQPGTCMDAHQRCESLGNGYRLMCGDWWNQGKTGEGCGGPGAFTSYDIITTYFPGSHVIGSWNNGQNDCVNNCSLQCNSGDCGYSAGTDMSGQYAFCAQKNFYTVADGPSFGNTCD